MTYYSIDGTYFFQILYQIHINNRNSRSKQFKTEKVFSVSTNSSKSFFMQQNALKQN